MDAPGPGRPLGSSYLLLDQIGRGATGQVWRASLRTTGEQLAIKLLDPELAQNHDFVSRFLMERSLLVKLRHPNLISVRDLVAEGDTLAIVMDLVEGEDLDKIIRREGALDWDTAARLVAGVAAGLAAVHDAGVVHGDIKPANILVDNRGGSPKALLTDFGIATMRQQVRPGGGHGPMGTPAYIAPEVASGSEPTSAADMYAC